MSDMDYNYRINMNGIDTMAVYSRVSVEKIFLPLLERLTNLQREKGRRILVFVAAPPGAGKSTLCSFLQDLSEKQENITDVQAIGMDGFHRRQEYLLSHTTIRDGKEIKMVEIKGAPETFDVDLFEKSIEKVLSEKTIGWPEYNRKLHNPVDDAITVNRDIVLLEGNYLLLDMPKWRDLKRFADMTIRITADKEMLKKRLVERKAASGNSLEDALRFVEFSDMANVELCLERSARADLELVTDADGNFSVRK